MVKKMLPPNSKSVPTVGRRKVLKGAAAGLGAAAGSSILGAPMIWAQKLKDISILQVGPSYSVIADIAEQASKDLGFKIEQQNLGTDVIRTRVLQQPETIDVVDIEFWALQRTWAGLRMQPIETKKIKNWDKMIPLFREGKHNDGSPVSRQGTMPNEVQYVESAQSKEFSRQPTGLATIIPTIYNADTLGIRPDLINRNINSWAELLDPEFKGKTALINIPQIGIMDAALAIEARGDITYGDKGNMTRAEIDKTMDVLTDLKKQGQFRAFWNTFDESVNLMAAGEVVVQSMWSPAVTIIRTRGIDCVYQGLKEGYRGWGLGMGLMKHLSGLKLEAAYEYLNWYLSGWQGAFIAKQGYYSSVPETAKAQLSRAEWEYWYEGKPATQEITDPYGATMEKAGRARDGGSFDERIGRISCWNTVMDEDRYMVRKWNQFISA